MAINKKILIITAASVLAAAVCAGGVLWYVLSQDAPEEEVTSVAETTEATEIPTETQYVLKDFGMEKSLTGLAETLLRENADTVGWITIPDTKVDAPVVQAEDNDYYLDTGFDHKPNRAGAVFMDYRNVFGSDLSAQSDNLVIYGHNMANNTMFGSLRKYRQDLEYYKTHRFVELSSNYESFTYVIFGLVITSGSADAEWRYWDMEEFADKKAFDDYVSIVRSKNMTDIDVDVQYGDQLLTLSTCYSDADDSRFLVIARKMRDGETAEDFAEAETTEEE